MNALPKFERMIHFVEFLKNLQKPPAILDEWIIEIKKETMRRGLAPNEIQDKQMKEILKHCGLAILGPLNRHRIILLLNNTSALTINEELEQALIHLFSEMKSWMDKHHPQVVILYDYILREFCQLLKRNETVKKRYIFHTFTNKDCDDVLVYIPPKQKQTAIYDRIWAEMSADLKWIF